MALIKCRECSAEVSSNAKQCPQCGISKPAKTHHKGAAVFVLMLAAVPIFMFIHGGNKEADTSTANAAPVVAATAPEPPPKPSCVTDWHRCKDNKELLARYRPHTGDLTKDTALEVACKLEAERLARYGTPSFPWLSFETFRLGDDYVKTGRATLIENNAQYDNGHGSQANVKVTCTYDLRTSTVADIHLSERY